MAKRNVEVEFSLIDGVSKGLGKIDKALGGVGKKLLEISPAAAAAAAAVGAIAIGAVLAKGVKEAAAFEVALDQISAKTGITGDALAQLGDQIKAIAQDASRTGDEGAAAFEKFTSEGFNAVDALAQLPAALNFATASAQGTADAVGSLTDNLDAFGLGAADFSGAADVIVAASLKGGTSVQQMQAALQAIGPTARDVGLSLEESAAAIARLGQNGLESTKAGKALATVFDELRNPASLFRKELAAIGVNTGDFQTVMARLAKGGKDTELAFSALGINGTAAIKSLVRDGGAGLAALNAELQKSAGITAATADTLNQNLVGAFNRATEAFKNLRVEFVEPLLAPLAGELDSITAKLREFVKTPEFEKLRTEFAAAFLDAIEAAKKFASEFDFSAAIKSVQDFVKSTGEGLKEFQENTARVAGAVRLVVEGIAGAFNALQAGVALAVTAMLRSVQGVTQVLGRVSSTARKISEEIRDFGDVAEGVAVNKLEKLRANGAALAEGFLEVRDNTSAATDELKKQPPVLEQINDAESRAAIAAHIMAEAEARAAEEARKFAKEQDAAGTSLGKFSSEAKTATAAVDGLAAVTKGTKDAYLATREAIQESIDATKEFAASADDAAESVADIGAAAEGARNQIEEDLSSAIFQGLSEGIARTAEGMALLGGVAESAIRDKLQAATAGALNGFVGLNNEIQRLDAILSSPAGAEQLERAARAAADLAEKIATATERARGLAQAQRDLTAALQEEADARDLSDREREQRRFAEEQRQIEELAKQRGFLGAAEAERQRQLSKANHEARLAEINAEAAERVRSELAADEEIAGRRAAGQAAVFARGESGAGDAADDGAGGRSTTTITINALDLRNAGRFVTDLDAELERRRRARL